MLELRDVTKHYTVGGELVRALDGVSIDVAEGEYVAIMGASGSGKSTLMNVLGCLDRPTAGTYALAGERVDSMPAARQAIVRNKHIGFVFQTFELLPRQTALRNVELPLLYAADGWRGRHRRATEALERVGLGDRMTHRPSQLSGGQRQRVAIARALVNRPSLLLADEPTGALDSKTTVDILQLFSDLHEAGQTVVVVTHEEDVAARAKRILRMHDGLVVSDELNQPATKAAA